MRRFLLLISILIVVSSFQINNDADARSRDATTWIVDQNGNGDFLTIGSAIENATDGDAIQVWDGTYIENIEMFKEVDLNGNGTGKTILQVGGLNSVACSWRSTSTLSNITIIGKNVYNSFCLYVSVIGTSTINDCELLNSEYGLCQASKKDVFNRITIRNCRIPMLVAGGSSSAEFNNMKIFCDGRNNVDWRLDGKNMIFRNCELTNISFPKNTQDCDIDTTNLVNGKPFRYYFQTSAIVPQNTGQAVIT